MRIIRKLRAGFSLIEVTLALGVVSFCLVPLVALLPLGMNSNQNASQQTAAAGIATSIVADMQSNAQLAGITPRFKIPMQNASTFTLFLADDGSATTGATGARYRATLNMTQDNTSTKLLKVWVLVTWPALADPSSAVPPKNFSGSYETSTAVDCF